MSAAVKTRRYNYPLSALALVLFTIVFLLPFAFILLTAAKDQQDAAALHFSWPQHWQLFENVREVLRTRDYILIIAFINSTILTVVSVTAMVVLASAAAFVLQRRRSRWKGPINLLMLSGLIVPPAVVPTIWVMQLLGIFKTLPGLILVEIAFGLSFCVLLFQAFMATIPRELDEAAIMDGASPLGLFFRIVLPLLRPVIVTVVVAQSVFVWSNFTNPLYFLPGEKNATVQLTLFNFQSQYDTSYNLLFADIVLITVPPLLLFLFFQRHIVAGLTAGSVKG
ncbi:carbohydrate ABC transporter permease [Flindersiella endophytica]